MYDGYRFLECTRYGILRLIFYKSGSHLAKEQKSDMKNRKQLLKEIHR